MSPWLFPLAQLARPEELGRRFRGPDSQFGLGDLLGLLLFAVVAAGLVWLLRWLLQRQNGISRYYHPWRLFSQICRVHKLSGQQRKLLRQLAHFLQLEHPATLFLLAELWKPEALGEEWEPWREEIEQLREKLFGAPKPPKDSAEETGQRSACEAPPAQEFLTDVPLELETPTA